MLVLVTSPSSPAAGCPVLGDGPRETVGPAGFQGRWVVWAQPLPRRAQGARHRAGLWQLVRMLLAFGSCSLRTRLRPWQRTRSQEPAGGVSSAPVTLMEALETEQLPSPGALSFSSSASLLTDAPNPALLPTPPPPPPPPRFSEHQQEVPLGSAPSPPSRSHALLELSSERCSGVLFRLHSPWPCSLGSFPESSQPSDFPPKFQ